MKTNETLTPEQEQQLLHDIDDSIKLEAAQVEMLKDGIKESIRLTQDLLHRDNIGNDVVSAILQRQNGLYSLAHLLDNSFSVTILKS